MQNRKKNEKSKKLKKWKVEKMKSRKNENSKKWKVEKRKILKVRISYYRKKKIIIKKTNRKNNGKIWITDFHLVELLELDLELKLIIWFTDCVKKDKKSWEIDFENLDRI